MTSIYFHEDDYCQLEILPAENHTFCSRQMGQINEFAEAHRSGAGYTDMFVREDNPVSLREKKIPVIELEEALTGILPKYHEVYTGYSSYREKCAHTGAFGKGQNVVLFYDEKESLVNNIWLTLDIKWEGDISAALDMFSAMSSLGDFIITDWGWNFVEELKSVDELEQYLHKRLEAFTR